MASPEFEQVRQLLAAIPPGEPQSIEERRQASEQMWPAFTADVEEATYQPVDAGGVPAEWIRLPGADDQKVLFYLHGGGYTIGSIVTHRKLAAHIARAAGTSGLVVDYRLAPENPFPAGLDDAVTAFEWLLAQGVEADDVVLAGDSAGGGLALATAVRLRDEGRPSPGAIVALSPWTDLAMTGDSIVTKREVDVLIRLADDGLDPEVGFYVGGESSDVDAKHPLVSPLYADLAGLPRMLVQVGTDEVLLDDSTRLAARAEQAGVPVTLEVWPEMIHVFQMGAGRLPEATEAVARIGAWLRAG